MLVVDEAITAEQRAQAFEIRRRVFRDEQDVPEELEFDADDARAVHVLATVDGTPAGTGRVVFRAGVARIGRMAVLKEWRRRGVGRAILDRLMVVSARHRPTHLVLHAQVTAIPFYQAAGFQVTSEVFQEAGIPHRRMERTFP